MITPELNEDGSIAGSEFDAQQPGPVEQYNLWKSNPQTYREPTHEEWIRALSDEEHRSLRFVSALRKVCSSLNHFTAISVARKAIERN